MKLHVTYRKIYTNNKCKKLCKTVVKNFMIRTQLLYAKYIHLHRSAVVK